MRRQVSKRGMKKSEPGDIRGQINDTVFQGAIDILFEGGYLDAKELLREFENAGIAFYTQELENYMGLKPGTLNVRADVINLVKIKVSNKENEIQNGKQ